MKTYSKMVFMDEGQKKEWDELDPQIKRTVVHNLKMYTDRMTCEATVNMLVAICQDLIDRVEMLENRGKE